MLHRLLALGALLCLASCSREPRDGAIHAFVGHPPHGGTPVALGDDNALEFVLDRASGRLDAYVLDDEMESFIRIAAPSFDLVANLPGGKRTLALRAVANPATGETVGATSLFEARADWLKTAGPFDAVIPRIDVNGSVFSGLSLHLP